MCNKEFFEKHYEAIDAIFKEYGIIDAKVCFDKWNTKLYIKIDPKKEEIASEPLIEKALMNLWNKHYTVYEIRLLGFSLAGQERKAEDFPKGTMSFSDLKPAHLVPKTEQKATHSLSPCHSFRT